MLIGLLLMAGAIFVIASIIIWLRREWRFAAILIGMGLYACLLGLLYDRIGLPARAEFARLVVFGSFAVPIVIVAGILLWTQDGRTKSRKEPTRRGQ
jgi:uncharacterized membrane protein YbaN (DUF454 family)